MTPQDETQQSLCWQLPHLPHVALSLEDLCHVISAERRRQLILVLADTCFDVRANTESLSITTLAQHVTALETDTDPGSVSFNEYRDIQIALYHNHVGILKRYNLVTQNESPDEITPTQEVLTVATLIRILRHQTTSSEDP